MTSSAIAVLVIFAATCGGLLTLVFTKPHIMLGGKKLSIFWSVPLLGALSLIIGGLLTPSEIAAGLTGAGDVNPIKILLLFFTMTMMSVYLDEIGFFRFLAVKVLGRAGHSQKVLFFLLYALVSVLTVFTSNDVIVLTFTPFICHFSKNARIDPIPYLVSEFVAANTWSMALIIGNPTNIYLAGSAGVDFGGYIIKMILPTILCGLVSMGVLYLLFRKKLAAPIDPKAEKIPPIDKVTEVLGLVHLGGCILLLSLSSFFDLPMWLITCIFFASLVVCTMAVSIFRRRAPFLIAKCILRAPWDLAPFVLSMFVLVLALDKYGLTAMLANWLGQFDSIPTVILAFGIASFLAANILNNIPMSVLFSSVIAALPMAELAANDPSQALLISAALFASVIGSNLGAFFTPTGALAGIMWTGQLHDHGVPFSFVTFVRYGATVAIPALMTALGGLILVFII
ncbi:MAG: hypothetical protein J6D87_09065 [Clostridia bacterium]|nr:hypothetical protein [Clostridia bacterium]